MVKWDSLRKTKRDEEIYRYWYAHQDISHKEIGELYHMSRTNVTRIINIIVKRLGGVYALETKKTAK